MILPSVISFVFLVVLASVEAAFHNVTIPSKPTFKAGMSAYKMSVGEVTEDISLMSFGFDVPAENPVILYKFTEFSLPSSNFNEREFCAKIECRLEDRQGNLINEIKASCQDIQNPDLFGPVVAVPGATNVTCTLIWPFPQDKSGVADTLRMAFVSAYYGFCEEIHVLANSSWCDVNVTGLVNADYEPLHQLLCMDKSVALETFNSSCYVPPSGMSSQKYLAILISLVSLSVLAVLFSIGFSVLCIASKRRRQKIASKEHEPGNAPLVDKNGANGNNDEANVQA
ncbi:unnamed protein product [Mesocestoides corti]|uniref:Integrin_alpha2 domain-containing protein n=1 Tax=Mesocestoides corti TaxID=53468 RepID=A0A0R3U967_MESCO|nr:unnamed protein product [Mesocestoides corti]